MVSWLTDIESYTFTEYEEQEGCSEPQPQEELDVNDDECSQSPFQTKRKVDSVHHRFASVAKRFKTQEHCDFEIDPVLALNITDLFHKGIDEEMYTDLIKDENNGRPEL